LHGNWNRRRRAAACSISRRNDIAENRFHRVKSRLLPSHHHHHHSSSSADAEALRKRRDFEIFFFFFFFFLRCWPTCHRDFLPTTIRDLRFCEPTVTMLWSSSSSFLVENFKVQIVDV
jgi:hypothetical protein